MAQQTITIAQSAYISGPQGNLHTKAWQPSITGLSEIDVVLRQNPASNTAISTVQFLSNGLFLVDLVNGDLSDLWESQGTLRITTGTLDITLRPSDIPDTVEPYHWTAAISTAEYNAISAGPLTLVFDDGATTAAEADAQPIAFSFNTPNATSALIIEHDAEAISWAFAIPNATAEEVPRVYHEVDAEPIAFSLTIPDATPALIVEVGAEPIDWSFVTPNATAEEVERVYDEVDAEAITFGFTIPNAATEQVIEHNAEAIAFSFTLPNATAEEVESNNLKIGGELVQSLKIGSELVGIIKIGSEIAYRAD